VCLYQFTEATIKVRFTGALKSLINYSAPAMVPI